MQTLGSSGKVTFKEYQPHQPTFLPPSLDELIAPDHLVRLVSHAIDRMDVTPIVATYKGGGASAFHPKMLLKVVIYAYAQRIYSARQIAKALREQIPFMWLAGGNRPDFRTINNFRSRRLKRTIEAVFASVLEMLIEEGLVKLEHYFLDGTTIEANANKYTHVWAKSAARYKELWQQKIETILAEIEAVSERENAEYGDRDLEELGQESEITSEKIEALAKKLSDVVKEEPENKVLGRQVKRLKGEHLPKLAKYEEQERILAGRGSYSKSDPDATFMRLKGEPPDRSRPKPAYNVQMGTENQFIVGFSVHQNPGDSGLLVPHLEKLKAQLGRLPEAVVADAAYGSEENYAYLDEAGVAGYLKYNTFEKEQKRRYLGDQFNTSTWPYDEEADTYTCPAGEALTYLKSEDRTTDNGYATTTRIYEARGCARCPLRERCCKGRGNRRLSVRPALNERRKRARELLLSAQGQQLLRRRGIEVESVFGQTKGNRGFRRFLLRGTDKVTVETGLMAIAHDLEKWWRARFSGLLSTLHSYAGKFTRSYRNSKIAVFPLIEAY